MIKKIDSLSRVGKSFILVFIDFFISIKSLYLIEYFNSNNYYFSEFFETNFKILFLLFFFIIIANNISRVTATAIRNLQFNNIFNFLFYSLILSSTVFITSFFGWINFSLFENIYFLLLFLLGVTFSRIAIYYFLSLLDHYSKSNLNNAKKNIAIFGAGSAGRSIIQVLDKKNYEIKAIIDDGPGYINTFVSGIMIYSRNSFQEIFSQKNINEIWVIIPSASQEELNSIFGYLSQFSVKIKKIPSLNELMLSGQPLNDPIEIDPIDVLGRKKITIDINLFSKKYENKNILITGAGGSIGSEITKQIISTRPAKLILIDISEFNLYRLEKSLHSNNSEHSIVKYFLCSVTNKELLNSIIQNENINVIIHAAAYKHVPIIEENILAGIQNNVLGTYTVIDAAISHKIERFVFISTDKAVRPTSIMGASKRMAELIIQNKANNISCMETAIVRFGNVLGSSGSVIPLFKEQIKNGGPVTLTDPDMTRYFMVIEEAAQLVLLAGSFGGKGEVYLLDMGKPVKILDLIKNMLKLEGLSVKDKNNLNGDIEIKVINKRKGEKLFEELLINKNDRSTSHSKVKVASEKEKLNIDVMALIKEINKEIESNNEEKLIEILEKNISEFKYNF